MTNQTDRELLMQIAQGQTQLTGDLKSFKELMEERCERHQKTTYEHHRVLFGNSRQGIKDKVTIMWWAFVGITTLTTLVAGGWMVSRVVAGNG